MLCPFRLVVQQQNSTPLNYIIPTFTVTINPLEANELTLPLPESPKKFENSKSHKITFDTSCGSNINNNKSRNSSGRKRSNSSPYGTRSIANTTIIVDDDGNEVVQETNDNKENERMLSVDGNGDDDEFRRYIYLYINY